MELTIADLKPFLPELEAALDDEAVSEVMVNGPAAVFIERAGRMTAVDAPALTPEAAARAAVQIARPLGRDPLAEPIIEARLADGSRVAICGPPAAPTAAITIRRFGGREFTIDELTASGSLPAAVVEAAGAVLGRERNLLICGGTGSGKTTLLNALVSLLPADGRIISIEDTLELRRAAVDGRLPRRGGRHRGRHSSDAHARRGAPGRADGPRPRLRRRGGPLGRRVRLAAAAVRERGNQSVDAERETTGSASKRKRRGRRTR